MTIIRKFIPLNIAVITVSDTRNESNDKSGNTLCSRLTKSGHNLYKKIIIKDDIQAIRNAVNKWLSIKKIDVIITTGGTGLTGNDVTPEAIKPLFDKEIPGFSIIFHQISYNKIETSTVQSRALAGVARGKYIFVLPGSPGACIDAWESILEKQLDYRHLPCNFVEIMPRLEENLKRK